MSFSLTGRFFALESILKTLGQAGPAKLIAALGVIGLVAATLFAIMFKVGGEDNAMLYSGLSPKDAASITEALEKAKVKYDVSSDGGTVYVPRSKVAEARMQLATDGLPAKASIGYEIFDKQDAMGQTSFVQNINKLRALEGELARSIDSLDTVKDSRVHLVIPEKQLFETDNDPPTASIVVGLEQGSLSSKEVNAIRSLVASAVKGLSPDKVTILDDKGELLASAQNGADSAASAADDRKAQFEERMRKRIQDIIEGVVGPGAARVQVSADMDFSQTNTTTEDFDPDKVVPRSTRTVEETGNERSSDGAVTQGQNVPDATQTQNNNNGNSSITSRTDETVNNEISKTTKVQVSSPGSVTKLSVAVAVDGVTTPAANGQKPTYTPRSQEEMDRITALVRSAAGIDDTRGDKLEVANVKFARSDLTEGSKASSKFDFTKNDIMRVIELLSMGLIAAALIFFVARPLVKGIFSDNPMLGNPALAGAGGPAGLPSGEGTVAGLPDSGGINVESTTASDIDLAQISGVVNANAMKQVSDVVKDNPDQTVAVIRNWLQERK